MFPPEFLTYLRQHTLVGIKVGLDRDRFLDLWMVEVSGRIFARSWSRSTSGWFGKAVEGEPTEIRFGDQILSVVGRRPPEEEGLMARIDRAYLERFTQPGNVPYAEGISKPEYHPFTVEFIPVS